MSELKSVSPLPCPMCEAEISLEDNVLSGELIQCLECASDIEVIATDGRVTLTMAPDVQEDWGE